MVFSQQIGASTRPPFSNAQSGPTSSPMNLRDLYPLTLNASVAMRPTGTSGPVRALPPATSPQQLPHQLAPAGSSARPPKNSVPFPVPLQRRFPMVTILWVRLTEPPVRLEHLRRTQVRPRSTPSAPCKLQRPRTRAPLRLADTGTSPPHRCPPHRASSSPPACIRDSYAQKILADLGVALDTAASLPNMSQEASKMPRQESGVPLFHGEVQRGAACPRSISLKSGHLNEQFIGFPTLGIPLSPTDPNILEDIPKYLLEASACPILVTALAFDLLRIDLVLETRAGIFCATWADVIAASDVRIDSVLETRAGIFCATWAEVIADVRTDIVRGFIARMSCMDTAYEFAAGFAHAELVWGLAANPHQFMQGNCACNVCEESLWCAMSSKARSPLLKPLDGVWTRRLHPYEDDRRIFKYAPFASVFEQFLNFRQTRGNTDITLWKLLEMELSKDHWTEFASDWLSFTLGGEVVARIPEEYVKLRWEIILNVFFARFSNAGRVEGDEIALNILQAAQMKHAKKTEFYAYANPPADFCYADELDVDHLAADTGEEDNTDADGDDLMDGSFADTDFMPDYTESRSSSNTPKRGVPKKSKKSHTLELALKDMPTRWLDRLNVFFFPVVVPRLKRSAVEVVHDYCQMRDLPRRDYKSATFQDALKASESGLLWRLFEICEPGNLLETSHPDVELSFRFHNWKLSYGELICKWIPPTITEEEYERDCFEFSSENWLVPCLKTLGCQIQGWNPETVYRSIMNTSLLKNAQADTSRNFLDKLADPKLAVVIYETWWHRAFLRRAKEEIWRPKISSALSGGDSSVAQLQEQQHQSSPSLSKGKKRSQKVQTKKADQHNMNLKLELAADEAPVCLLCKALTEDEKCTREYEVHRFPNADEFKGVAMTCAPEHDRLQPLALPDDEKAGKVYVPSYANPEALGFAWIKPRPKTFERCGKDITRFVYREQGTEQLVGGVRYHAMGPKTLDQLISNHRRVVVRGVRRRGEIERWNYGTMTGGGPRQPTGGRTGDVYGPYACHKGNTADDIRALFRHALDNDVLVEIGTTIIPTMRADIKAVTEVSQTSRMGRYGLTTFNCTDYISAMHPDFDVSAEDVKNNQAQKDCTGTCYPCGQLEQTGTNKEQHEWDFIMVEFGLVIETHSNTVW
ncbi:hypothetical protein B0H19DRAFT_1067415 [Mycena capillaripes]|nr:hypothetical protein B0H19DRAFT_1067415 [Mycena capillaripes]